MGHNEVEFGSSTIHSLFYTRGQSFPKAHEWGCIAAVAWGGSRAMDYLESDHEPLIDATRVAVMGHSKMGKAALWTAASDTRFAMAVGSQSGCAGASPTHTLLLLRQREQLADPDDTMSGLI